MRLPASLVPALFLASCALAPPAPPPEETPRQAQERRAKAPRPVYNLAGYPPAVRDGYIDGCETAKNSEYGRKDEKRFARDARYRMGWNDGLSMCAVR
ncbi:MAG TPA: hypothetical protein PK042_09735 [Usitatibacteraceae bacterium]|nr:hypothetical protein [Usitatibacteraceae bacterium]